MNMTPRAYFFLKSQNLAKESNYYPLGYRQLTVILLGFFVPITSHRVGLLNEMLIRTSCVLVSLNDSCLALTRSRLRNVTSEIFLLIPSLSQKSHEKNLSPPELQLSSLVVMDRSIIDIPRLIRCI